MTFRFVAFRPIQTVSRQDCPVRPERRANVTRLKLPSSAQFLVAFGAVYAVRVSGVLGPTLSDLLHLGLGVVAIAVVVAAVRAAPITERRPWRLVCVALTLWLAGAIARQVYGTLGDLSSGRHPLPDIIVLAGHVVALLAVFSVLAARARRHSHFDVALDAGIAAFAACVTGWVLIVSPAVARPDVGAPLIIYPLLAIATFTVAVNVGYTQRALGIPAYRYVLASVGCLVIGDINYMLAELPGFNPPTAVLDLPLIAGLALLGASVLHPSVVHVTERQVRDPESLAAPTRIWLISGALLIPSLVALGVGVDSSEDRVALAVTGAGLVLFAGLRVHRAFVAQAALQQHVDELSERDALTGLPARRAMTNYILDPESDIAVGRHIVGVLAIDIDRFGFINEGLGSNAGDHALLAVADRLRPLFPHPGLLARSGDDNFFGILAADNPEAITECAERVQAAFEAPLPVADRDLHLTVSVGLNMISPTAPFTDWYSMIDDANAALVEAKRKGLNQIVAFDRSMRSRVDRRVLIERELRFAVQSRQVSVQYQPVMTLPEGEIAGIEALARWDHPRLGSIEPSEFISAADEIGLISQIGDAVMAQALADLSQWRADGLPSSIRLSLNVSMSQIVDPKFHRHLLALLRQHKLRPEDIRLEINARADLPAITDSLQELRRSGIELVLDDFVAGYESLSLLKAVPADAIKMSRPFVAALGADNGPPEEMLVAALVSAGEASGAALIACGVETAQQSARLFELGVGLAQGYFFDRPMPASELAAKFVPSGVEPQL